MKRVSHDEKRERIKKERGKYKKKETRKVEKKRRVKKKRERHIGLNDGWKRRDGGEERGQGKGEQRCRRRDL